MYAYQASPAMAEAARVWSQDGASMKNADSPYCDQLTNKAAGLNNSERP